MILTINNKEILSKELEGYSILKVEDLQTKEYLFKMLDLNKMPSEYKISIAYRTNDYNSFGYYYGCFYNGDGRIHYDFKKEF